MSPTDVIEHVAEHVRLIAFISAAILMAAAARAQDREAGVALD
jgi:hypothetical protein